MFFLQNILNIMFYLDFLNIILSPTVLLLLQIKNTNNYYEYRPHLFSYFYKINTEKVNVYTYFSLYVIDHYIK